MFENVKEQNVVEQTLETGNDNVSRASVEEAPITPSNDIEDSKSYLAPKIFKDIKVVKIDKNDRSELKNEVDPKVEELYASTFGDISENTLIDGRVVGMNDRDVLIDIGFKSEGIIDRSEFDKNELPKIGDQVEVYLEYIEDAGGNTI